MSQRWTDRYGEQAKALLNEFVEAEDWMVGHVAHSPAVAEEFMISNIVDLEAPGAYDLVVWDTAASSSTMHLLLLQKELYNHLDRDVTIYLRLKEPIRHSGALRIFEEWKTLGDELWKAVELTRFYLVTTMDELSLTQADEIARDIESMRLAIAARTCNRCNAKRPEASDAVLAAPELDGSALAIVEELKPYATELLGQKVH